MARREISLWMDEHWYNALSKHLKDETLEEHLENVLDEMCNQLPDQEYERICTKIWQEEQQARREREASRQFAAFHVTERGSDLYFTAEGNMDMLQTAVRLRTYLREPSEYPSAQFTWMLPRCEQTSREKFEAFVSERLENTGRVVGAFEIDLDNGTFDALHIMDGWQRFRVQDVSTAAYFAMKKSDASWDNRWKVFMDHLNGKQITQGTTQAFLSGSRMLREEDVSFSGEITQNDNLLEFYMDVAFDADQVFGTQVCSTKNDDWLNAYADYDMEAQCVCDTLEVYLVRSNGSEQDYKYRLTEEEQALMLPKMEEYCQHRLSLSLEECCSQYRQEQQPSPQGMQL